MIFAVLDLFSVMWSETIDLRTRPVWDEKNRSWSWSCKSGVVLWNTVLSRSLSQWSWNPQKFSSTIYSFSVLVLEHHYCGDQQWRSLT